MLFARHHRANARQARDLTLEAARDASALRKPPPSTISTASTVQLKKLLDSRNEREVLEGLRRVVAVCSILPDSKTSSPIELQYIPDLLYCSPPSSRTLLLLHYPSRSSSTYISYSMPKQSLIRHFWPSTRYRRHFQRQTHIFELWHYGSCRVSKCP
jgi:hypothetical protein